MKNCENNQHKHLIESDKSKPAEASNLKRGGFNHGVYPKTKRVNWSICVVGTFLCPSHLETLISCHGNQPGPFHCLNPTQIRGVGKFALQLRR